MPNINRVILGGNLACDPDLRYTARGTPVTHLTLATANFHYTVTGERTQDTQFIDCTLFGSDAEEAGYTLSKGQALIIEGRIQIQHGTKTGRAYMTVVAERFQKDRSASAPPRPSPETTPPAPVPAQA